MKLWQYLFFIIFTVGLNSNAIPGTPQGIKSLPEEFKAEAREILKKFQDYEKSKMPEASLSLDLDDKAYASIFSKPGIFSHEECEQDAIDYRKTPGRQCKVIGTPDNKSIIQPTGKIDFRIAEDADGNETLFAYTQVNFSYQGDKGVVSGMGWIPQDYISFKPVSPSYKEIIVDKINRAQDWVKRNWNEICDPALKTAPVTPVHSVIKNLTDIAKVSEAITEKIQILNKERKTVSEVADSLSSLVGKCVLNPPNVAPQNFTGSIAYDQFALPVVNQTALPKGIKKEDGKEFSRQDLTDIDALTRTMFAEMASCTPIGAQYPMAVARVIKNRELAMQKNPQFISEFVKKNSQHDPGKTLLCKAATSPILFSAWNQEVIDFAALKKAREEKAVELQKKYKIKLGRARALAKKEVKPNPDSNPKAFYKKNDSGLLHSLCPPSDPRAICYTGAKPNGNFNTVWQNTLRIATEAILFPKQFLEKTAELEGIKHYTSNRDKFYDFKQVKLSIEGREISSKRCLNLWKKK